MRPLSVLLLAAALCGPGFAPGPAWADSRDSGGSWCDQNPGKCADLKARRDQYCRKNPQACETNDTRGNGRRDSGNDRPERRDARPEGRQRRN